MNNNCFGKAHYYFVLIMVFLFPFLVNAQGYNTTNWKFSNPKQFGFTLLDVDYFDNNNVIAVGADGGIAKSTDGGSNWVYGGFTYTNPAGLLTKSTFNDVHYVSANTAYAVGDRGSMVKTTDGGATWTFVNTPLFTNSKNINACWFLDANKGYIGGQNNGTLDSLPKLYVTLNGGATWDSVAAPASNGVTRCGYINNPNIASVLLPVDAKLKEIYRIEFLNNNIGYICGTGSPLFPTVSRNAVAATCLPGTGNLTTGAHTAALLWKFENGVLTDYSISKERIGYSGINTNTVTCTTGFGNLTPAAQTYRAMNIINDSTVVMMSFNNNTVVRVHTGVVDRTANINNGGAFEKGKYVILNFPFPPTGGPQAGPPIPNPQVLLASNPYQIKRAANGKLYANGNFSRLWTSTDTGRNWKEERSMIPGQNFSTTGVWAMDIAPNGKFLFMGTNGAVSDSVAGAFNSNYKVVAPGGGYAEIEFADCNTGIATGGSFITTTNDGGTTWTDRFRADFQALNINISAVAFPFVNKAYFTTTNGALYRSPDRGVTMDPVFSNGNFQFQDVVAIGQDSIWVVANSAFSVPAASRTSAVFRSFNNGVTWTAYNGFPVGSAVTALTKIHFPSRQVGYVAGSRSAIYKTTDGGVTWTDISPFPAITPLITFTEVFAVNDNTVFACGNGFPRKVVFKSIDGGVNWTDITGNIPALATGNLNGILMHDANNGYVVTPGGPLLKTTNGGASWTQDIAPMNTLFEMSAFAPKTVPPGVSMQNRKLFVTGFGLQGTAIMEYGNPVNIAVNSTETTTNATCTNLTAGSITINATGAIAPYTYSIDGGAFQTSNTFTGLAQGPHSITIKDAYCGSLTKTVTVGFTDNLTLTTNNDTSVCAGAPVQMIATSAANTYSWSPQAGLNNPNISNPVAIINNATTYTVTASLNGCVKTKNVTISIRPNPVINAGPDKTIVSGDAVTLDGSIPASIIPQTISWAPAGTLTGANTLTPVARPAATTTYTVTVLDNNNCTATDAAVITVIPYCVKVMDAFTPNGDAKNDLWLVTNGAPCAGQISVLVYNRYGGLVYQNKNYQNNWDGTYNGKPVADGTYYYTITYRLINGNPVMMKGDVTILR